MAMHYSNPRRASDPHALPDVETFQLTATEVVALDKDTIYDFMRRPEFRLARMNSRDRDAMLAAIVEEQGITGGWFYQVGFPGCMPDGEPVGPFPTKADAVADARAGVGDGDASEGEEG